MSSKKRVFIVFTKAQWLLRANSGYSGATTPWSPGCYFQEQRVDHGYFYARLHAHPQLPRKTIQILHLRLVYYSTATSITTAFSASFYLLPSPSLSRYTK